MMQCNVTFQHNNDNGKKDEVLCDHTSKIGLSVMVEEAPTFFVFCLILNNPVNADILQFVATGRNLHTLFAPTDEAFFSIPGFAVTAADNDGNPTAINLSNQRQRGILGAHILPSFARVLLNLRCDGFYRTYFDYFPEAAGNGSYSSRQSTKTKCLNGGTTAQIGRGNPSYRLPVIGSPSNVFEGPLFLRLQPPSYTFSYSSEGDLSRDVVVCNGVLQVIDNVILPVSSGGQSGRKSGKGGKGFYGGSKHTKMQKYGKDTKKQKYGKDRAQLSFYDPVVDEVIDEELISEASVSGASVLDTSMTLDEYHKQYFGIGGGNRRDLLFLNYTKKEDESGYGDGRKLSDRNEERKRRTKRLLELLGEKAEPEEQNN